MAVTTDEILLKINAGVSGAGDVTNLSRLIGQMGSELRATGENSQQTRTKMEQLRDALLKAAQGFAAGSSEATKLAQAAAQVQTRLTGLERAAISAATAQQRQADASQRTAAAAQRAAQAATQQAAEQARANSINAQIGGIAQNASAGLGSLRAGLLAIIGPQIIGGLQQVAQGLKGLADEANKADTTVRVFDLTMGRFKINLNDANGVAERLSQKFGASLTSVKDSITTLVRAGFRDMGQLEQVMTGAAASSIAFGRSAEDGFSRVGDTAVTGLSAALNAIGVSENLGPAMDKYAKGIGKTADELTDLERAQVVANLVLKATATEVEALPSILNEYTKAQQENKQAVTEARQELGRELMPVVTALTRQVTDAVKGTMDWARANKDTLIPALKDVAVFLVDAANAVKVLLAFIADLGVALGGVGALLIGFATAIAGGVVGGIHAAISEIGRLFQTSVEGLAALQKAWDQLKSGNVVGAIITVKTAVENYDKSIKAAPSNIMNGVRQGAQLGVDWTQDAQSKLDTVGSRTDAAIQRGTLSGNTVRADLAGGAKRFTSDYISSLADAFKNDPRVKSDCAIIAYEILNKIGAHVKGKATQNAWVPTLEKNAKASGFQEVALKDARPGDLIIFKSGNGIRYGAGSGMHAGVVADNRSGQISVIDNPGTQRNGQDGITRVRPIGGDAPQATFYRAPNSPYREGATPKPTADPDPTVKTAPVKSDAALIAEARRILTRLEEAQAKGDLTGATKAKAVLKTFTESSDRAAAAVEYVQLKLKEADKEVGKFGQGFDKLKGQLDTAGALFKLNDNAQAYLKSLDGISKGAQTAAEAERKRFGETDKYRALLDLAGDAAGRARTEREKIQRADEQASREQDTRDKARAGALRTIRQGVQKDREEDFKQAIQTLKNAQQDELAQENLTAAQREQIIKRTSPAILSASYTLNAAIKKGKQDEAEAWRGSEAAKALTAQQVNAEVKRLRDRARDEERTANLAAQRDQRQAEQQAGRTRVQEEKQLAAELRGLKTKEAQATANRLKSIEDGQIGRAEGNAQKQLDLTRKYSQAQYERQAAILVAEKVNADRAATGKPNEDALRSTNLATYREGLEGLKQARINAVRAATKAVEQEESRSAQKTFDAAEAFAQRTEQRERDQAALRHRVADERRQLSVAAANAELTRTQELSKQELDVFKGSAAERLVIVKRQAEDEYQARLSVARATREKELRDSASRDTDPKKPDPNRKTRDDGINGRYDAADLAARGVRDAATRAAEEGITREAEAVDGLTDKYKALMGTFADKMLSATLTDQDVTAYWQSLNDLLGEAKKAGLDLNPSVVALRNASRDLASEAPGVRDWALAFTEAEEADAKKYGNGQAATDASYRQSYGAGDEGLIRSLAVASRSTIAQVRADVFKSLDEAKKYAPEVAGIIERVWDDALKHRREVAGQEAELSDQLIQDAQGSAQRIADAYRVEQDVADRAKITTESLNKMLAELRDQGRDPVESGFVSWLEDVAQGSDDAAAAAQIMLDTFKEADKELERIAQRGADALWAAQNPGDVPDVTQNVQQDSDGGFTFGDTSGFEQSMTDAFLGDSPQERLQNAISLTVTDGFKNAGQEAKEAFWSEFDSQFGEMNQDTLASLGVDALRGILSGLGNDEALKGWRDKFQGALEQAVSTRSADAGYADLGNALEQFGTLDSHASGYADTLREKLLPELERIRDSATDPALKQAAEQGITYLNGEVDAARQLADLLGQIKLTQLDRLKAAGGIGGQDYIQRRQDILVEQENARYRLDIHDKTGKALELAEAQHQINLGRIIAEGQDATRTLTLQIQGETLKTQRQREATDLENRHERAALSEAQYLTERQAQSEQAARDEFAARVLGLKEGEPRYIAAEAALQAQLTAIAQQGERDRTALTYEGQIVAARKRWQGAMTQYASGQVDTRGLAAIAGPELASMEKLARNLERMGNAKAAAEVRAVIAELRGGLPAAAQGAVKLAGFLENFNKYADYIQQLAGAFGGLADALGGSDLAANLNGVANAAGKAISIIRAFASGNIVGGIVGIVSTIADAIGGFRRAREEARKAHEDFKKTFSLIDSDSFSKFYTRSRGFFADLFGGGPEVVKQINEAAASIAKTIESGVLGGFQNGIKAFLNGTGDMLSAVREGVRGAIIDAITTAVVQGAIIKGALGSLLTQLTTGLAAGQDVGAIISQIGQALPAVVNSLTTALTPLKTAIDSALPASNPSSSTSGGFGPGSGGTFQAGTPAVVIDVLSQTRDLLRGANDASRLMVDAARDIGRHIDRFGGHVDRLNGPHNSTTGGAR